MTGLIISSSIFDGTNDLYDRHDGQAVSWERSRARVGGDLDGGFVLTGDITDLSRMWREMLGFDVREEEGEAPWRGFVWATTLHHMGVSKTLSYESLHNAVRAKFKGLVVNGGFEVPSDEYSAGWDFNISGLDVISTETTVANVATGARSMKAENVNNGDTYASQTITVKARENYRLTFSNRGDDSEYGRYAVLDNSNSNWIVNNTSTEHFTDNYKKITREFVTPEDCTEIKIYFFVPSSTGIAWYDDVEVVRIDVEGNPIFSYTDWYTNAESIARYGRKELVINADKTSPEKAEAQAQNKLAAHAWPKPSQPRIADSGQNETYLEVECVGYWATAFFKYVDFENSSQVIGANETISDLITAVLGDDCDWLSAVEIQANSDEYQTDRAGDITAGALIEKLVTGNYRLTVDSSQGVIYEAIGTSPTLYRYLANYTESPGGLTAVDGRKVQAGIVVRDMDWPTAPGHYQATLQNENDYIVNEWGVSTEGDLQYRG